MHVFWAGLIAICLSGSLFALPSTARAGSEPAAACALAGASLPTADLVLGHFRGGRIVRAADGVPLIIWASEYNCFTSRHQCEAWQRKMNHAYRNVEGDRTCLPIR